MDIKICIARCIGDAIPNFVDSLFVLHEACTYEVNVNNYYIHILVRSLGSNFHGFNLVPQVTVGDTMYTSAKTFEDLNLSPDLLKGLYVEMKFERPSKIQAHSLPMILTPPYKHLIAQAHNGSGKTTCFMLGMLSRVDPKLGAPQALCICPTRELAIQVSFMHNSI